MEPLSSATPAEPLDDTADRPVRVLLDATARGDRDAFARLYDDWFAHVMGVTRRLTQRDDAFCLDITHDVFITLMKRTPKAATQPELAAWLKTVARRRALDTIRAERRRLQREHDAGQAPTHTDPATNADDLHRLNAELARLEDNHADLIDKRHRLGWTLDRIGRSVGLSASAVDGRLRRITARLADRMKENHHG